MKILRSVGAGLLSATSALARRMAFTLLFLGAGLVLAQPCEGASGVPNNTDSLATARFGQTATLLPNGKVLVAEVLPDSPAAAFSRAGSGRRPAGSVQLQSTDFLRDNNAIIICWWHFVSITRSQRAFVPQPR